jgi:hypothetical protein
VEASKSGVIDLENWKTIGPWCSPKMPGPKKLGIVAVGIDAGFVTCKVQMVAQSLIEWMIRSTAMQILLN